MAQIQRIKGSKGVIMHLQKLQAIAHSERSSSVIVGYEAAYALYVHEMEGKNVGKNVKRAKPHKGSYWDPQGRAGPKFLEKPAREHSDEIGSVIVKAYRRKIPFSMALKVGALLLQRYSMKMVPVDTSNLKSSAFTKVEK